MKFEQVSRNWSFIENLMNGCNHFKVKPNFTPKYDVFFQWCLHQSIEWIIDHTIGKLSQKLDPMVDSVNKKSNKPLILSSLR